MSSRLLTVWLTALSVAVTIGCAGGPPAERAVTEGISSIGAGIDAGHQAIEDLDVIAAKARYNPCQCPAPDFELHVEGRWTRVVIDGESQLVDDLVEQGQQSEASPGLDAFVLEGRFVGQRQFETTGIDYDVFEIDAFDHLNDPDE